MFSVLISYKIPKCICKFQREFVTLRDKPCKTFQKLMGYYRGSKRSMFKN